MSEKSPYKIADPDSKFPRTPEVFVDIKVVELTADDKATVANSKIPKGAIIFKDGGVLVSSIADVEHKYRYAVLVDDGVWLAPLDYDDMDVTCFLNHSCQSNVARLGGLIYVAKRNIEPGEQLTVDYAPLTTDYKDWKLECRCGQINCRKTITSLDYENPAIAKELWNEWLPYIQRKIIARGIL